VEDPLDLKKRTKTPLFVGAYVRAAIEGVALDNVCPVPRSALREGGVLWVAEPTEKAGSAVLRIRRDVEVLHRTRDRVFVRRGLADGEAVVIGRIPVPVEGAKLRLPAPPKKVAVKEAVTPGS
jgi:hypothetical protein